MAVDRLRKVPSPIADCEHYFAFFRETKIKQQQSNMPKNELNFFLLLFLFSVAELLHVSVCLLLSKYVSQMNPLKNIKFLLESQPHNHTVF